jgi:aminoglycoside phosphotransferase (APT) family kinase protein
VIEERVSRLAGMEVRELRPIKGGGYAASFRAVAALADGRTVFVKAGAEEVTSSFLRDEQRVYAALNRPFMPELVGMDEEEPPLLVLEDLSGGHWPPPWDYGSVAAVRKTLEAVAATPTPEWLPSITLEADWLLGGWAEVERDPRPFLSAGLCSAKWLERSLPALRAAAENAPIEGEALLHLDVRSDNICLTGRGAVLVDWNHAHRGNPDLDLAFWLPSLADEGGPEPETILGGAGGLAAVTAGFFGSRVGLPPPPTAPQVRAVQLSQLRVALPWAARELDLPPPS